MPAGFHGVFAFWIGGAGPVAAIPPTGDTTPPTITVLNVGGPIYTTYTAWYEIVGRTDDNMGVVRSVTWSNHRGGSGTALGVNPWFVRLKLHLGSNILTFTATDAQGNTASTWILVIYTKKVAFPPPNSNTLLPLD